MGCVGNLDCQCEECRKVRGDVDEPFDYSDVEFEDGEYTNIPVSIETECRIQASTELDTKAGIATLRRASDEIIVLREELKGVEIELAQSSGLLDDALRSIEELENQLEEANKDAARYRWMRDVGQEIVEVFIFNETNNCPNNFATWHGFTDMNSAIDDGMKRYPLELREEMTTNTQDTSEFYTKFAMAKFVSEEDRQKAIAAEWHSMQTKLINVLREKDMWKTSTEFYKTNHDRYKKFLDVYDTEEFTAVEWDGKKAISAYLDKLIWEDKNV